MSITDTALSLPDWVEDEAGFSGADNAFSGLCTQSASLCYQMFLNEVESAWQKGWPVGHVHFIPASDADSTLEVYFDHLWVDLHGQTPARNTGNLGCLAAADLTPLDQGILDAVTRFLEIDASRFFAIRRWIFTPITPDSLDDCRRSCMGEAVFGRYRASREKSQLDLFLPAGEPVGPTPRRL